MVWHYECVESEGLGLEPHGREGMELLSDQERGQSQVGGGRKELVTRLWVSGALGRAAVMTPLQEELGVGEQHQQVCLDSGHHSAHIPLLGNRKYSLVL